MKKKGSEIFTGILLEKQLMTEVEITFFVFIEKWCTLNDIDKGHTAFPYATSKK